MNLWSNRNKLRWKFHDSDVQKYVVAVFIWGPKLILIKYTLNITNILFVYSQKEEQRELTYILAVTVYPDGLTVWNQT